MIFGLSFNTHVRKSTKVSTSSSIIVVTVHDELLFRTVYIFALKHGDKRWQTPLKKRKRLATVSNCSKSLKVNGSSHSIISNRFDNTIAPGKTCLGKVIYFLVRMPFVFHRYLTSDGFIDDKTRWKIDSILSHFLKHNW